MELVDLNEEQMKAFKAFKQAYCKCKKANIQFYTVLETIFFLNGDKLNPIGNKWEDPAVEDVANLGHNIGDSGFAGWADDRHSITLKD